MNKEKIYESALNLASSIVLDEGGTIYLREIAERIGVTLPQLEEAIGSKKAFSEKVTLFIGAKIWQREADIFGQVLLSEKYAQMKGAQQVKELWLAGFLYTYRGHPDFWRWLYRFEQYIVAEKVPAEQLGDYQNQLEKFFPVFMEAFEKGQGDGTIRSDLRAEEYYGATSLSLMSICLKFCSAPIIATDTTAQGDRLLVTVIDMACRYLKQ